MTTCCRGCVVLQPFNTAQKLHVIHIVFWWSVFIDLRYSLLSKQLTKDHFLKMAASDQAGGYKCEFVGPISEEFWCKVCNLVAREPYLTSCCGNHFCHTCISQVQQDKKPCPEPTCQEPQFTVFLNKGLRKRIVALRVHCTMKDRGCLWNGQLEDLDAHLNVETSS